MTAGGFDPESIAVKPGATIVWKNLDEKVHSLEIVAGEARSDPVIISPGESYSYVFKDADEFTYFDAETGKSGTLTVGPAENVAPVKRTKVDFVDARSGLSDVSMRSGSVTGVEIIAGMRALLVSVDAQSYDVLQMTIDRKLLDSRASDNDVPFSIRAGGGAADYDEVGTSDKSRTIRIILPAGTESVLIRGNFVAEEPLGYQNAYSALNEAASVIAAYKDKGIVTKEADDRCRRPTPRLLGNTTLRQTLQGKQSRQRSGQTGSQWLRPPS